MKKFTGLFLLICMGLSCKKSNETSNGLSGTYTGIFTLKVGSTGTPVPVTVIFSGSNFQDPNDSGLSLICHGDFHIDQDSINFQNECFYPANIDLLTVLGGKYRIYIQGDSVSFSRTIGDLIYEEAVYSLKKQ
jgi:hypothetical protein